MPKILDERVKKLQKSGMSKSQAYGIATKQLQKSGKLKKGTQKLKKKKK